MLVISFNKNQFVLKVARNKYDSTYKTIKVVYNNKTYINPFDSNNSVNNYMVGIYN